MRDQYSAPSPNLALQCCHAVIFRQYVWLMPLGHCSEEIEDELDNGHEAAIAQQGNGPTEFVSKLKW